VPPNTFRRGIMTATTRHFSPRASLAALGLRLRRLGLLEAITAAVKVPQKTVRHTPAEKLYDAFLAILSGAHGGFLKSV
jgi:NaMN:DMB phosphoribosyltransferase